MTEPTTWLITGANRGFGLETTQEALRRGHRVAATARRPDTLRQELSSAGEALLVLPLDVNQPEQVEQAVAETVRWAGSSADRAGASTAARRSRSRA